MRTRLLLPLALALAGCASAPPAPPGPPPFQGVRSVLLVREARGGEREARPKDPLDAVRESLDQRGLTARTVEVGPRLRDDLAGVARLYRRVEARVAGGPLAGPRGRAVERIPAREAGALADLGADAAVVYLRFELRPLPPPMPSGGPLYPPLPRAFGRPMGALALVDREGNLLWFDWGGDQDDLERDRRAPVNAAEAVDAVLRVIAGEPPDA